MSLTTSSTSWMSTCHMQVEQVTTMNYSDEPCTMSLFPCDFDEADAMFLKFTEDLDNLAGRSSSVGDNLSTSQPSATSTPRRRDWRVRAKDISRSRSVSFRSGTNAEVEQMEKWNKCRTNADLRCRMTYKAC
ncbi:cytochrome P450 CYP82D47-like [Cucumis melo var. makuwa]|uniref:Cytochrome P450 CYP82D47-like n=1 Tax=Cucumis melo var. makuwa TaxID=1194695 RepID=A0A5A7TT23_CUCMM|nr:cytochrome P450 CYP82D47-like [Cucumis melo var. makuwa]